MGWVTYFLLTVQLLVRDVGRQVGMKKSAEGQAITPAAAEICDINVLWGKSGINHQTVPSHRLCTRLLRWVSISGFAGRQDEKLLRSAGSTFNSDATNSWCGPNPFTEYHEINKSVKH